MKKPKTDARRSWPPSCQFRINFKRLTSNALWCWKILCVWRLAKTWFARLNWFQLIFHVDHTITKVRHCQIMFDWFFLGAPVPKLLVYTPSSRTWDWKPPTVLFCHQLIGVSSCVYKHRRSPCNRLSQAVQLKANRVIGASEPMKWYWSIQERLNWIGRG